jgi:hypothetical protein
MHPLHPTQPATYVGIAGSYVCKKFPDVILQYLDSIILGNALVANQINLPPGGKQIYFGLGKSQQGKNK